jgi:hypothetical protein
MSDGSPYIYAWCDEADRVDAFAAAMSVLVAPGGLCSVDIASIDHPGETWRRSIPVDELVAVVRSAFATGTHVFASLPVILSSGRALAFALNCNGEAYERRGSSGPLCASPYDRTDVLPQRIEVAVGGGAPSVEVEAAILSIQVQQDIEDLMVRVCVPDAGARVTTGCTTSGDWYAPIEACATYHADAEKVARDLALSWIHLHDGDNVELAAGMSLSALWARVEAAQRGACVAVAGEFELLRKHFRLEYEAAKEAKHAHVKTPPRRARFAIPGDAELTREQVLAALSTPPATLLEALEACAVPDDEWRAVEPLALNLIEAKKQGAPAEEVKVFTGGHTRFIERHAPYHVRRLPNGGVLLATHPYRTLWQLWADVLFLLGIRS